MSSQTDKLLDRIAFWSGFALTGGAFALFIYWLINKIGI